MGALKMAQGAAIRAIQDDPSVQRMPPRSSSVAHDAKIVGRAAVLNGFGDAEQLQLRELTWTPPRADEVIVRVHGSSINPIEWKMRQGMGLPSWAWRKLLGAPAVLGLDFSGTVECAGKESGIAEGAEVMGALPLCGAYADYIRIRPAQGRLAIVRKPESVSHARAGVTPFASLVALAAFQAAFPLDPSWQKRRVLIVGGSGGVGHLGLQMAKRGLGAAQVVAVCSSRNSEFAAACGADDVVCYDQIDVPVELAGSRPGWRGTFDLIFDAVGDDRYWTQLAPQLLRPGGQFVSVALPSFHPGRAGEDVGLLEAPALIARLLKRQMLANYRMIPGLIGALPGTPGLRLIAQWLDAGELSPHIMRSYPLAQVAAAHRESETGRAVGKIALQMD
jgi:NADPH:quinone reductase-like Zn-dependent oxidoreductase